MENQFSPDIELEHRERAELALLVNQAGYPVLHKIIRSEVDKFVVDLLNADEDKTVLEKHRRSKVAVQLYEGWTNHVNQEVQNYTAYMQRVGPPVDPTDGLLDLGAVASRDVLEISPLEGGNDGDY